ncbi:snapalysin [Streptomyces sp. NPDC052302]|uniref:snapalysin n=1 Tax=Streptomyces sp. NPDC052302 TaxID=3365688 RepID=UPI0037D70E2D
MRMSFALSARTTAAAALGVAALGLGMVAPATAAPAHTHAQAGFVAGPSHSDASKAFFQAVLKSVAEKQAARPTAAAAVTVVYDASGAPTFSAQIARSAQIWNSSVSNVKLQSGSNADFTYREGNDSRGSYASTDGHGNGYVFLDYQQKQEYDSTRVTTHETGHVLGLPDHYEGPCSELMSGGGPGPSCTNSQPDSNERARVEQLWANGFAAALDKALDKGARR